MRKIWTPDEIEFLREHYADNFTEDLAHALNRSDKSVYAMAYQLGLKKSEEIIRQTGSMSSNHPNVVASRFKKGQTPPNKGEKMAIKTYEKVSRTFFSKGHLPHNTKSSDGEITRRNDGHLYIRVSLGKWEQLRKHNWERQNGKIPFGMCITQIDGNPDNCDITNLRLISRSDNMRRNTIHNLPAEIKDTIRVISKLNKVIRKYEKRNP